MSFIAYYAFHSFINQIRKMLKTWVLVFILACGLIGGLIGFGVGMLSDISDDMEPVPEPGAEWYSEDYGPSAEPPGSEVLIPPSEDPALPGDGEEGSSGVRDIFELIYGGVILAAMLLSILMAEKGNGGRFLPADVSLLFASPLRPQTVLFFRLLMQLGVMLYMTVYMLINFGNIAENMGIGLPARIMIMLGWFFSMFFGKLLETYIYLASADSPKTKRYADGALYALILVPAAAWFTWWKANGGSPLKAAFSFFNAPLSRVVPIWGWIKGMGMYAAEGRMSMSLLCLVATVAGAALFTRHIWNMNADFYEEAMAKSEELAQAMRDIEEKKSAFGSAKKKKIKSDIERDGMNRGLGASVFFWKSVLNRKRFSKLLLITKTSGFYLAVAAGVSFFMRSVMESSSCVPAAFALGAMVFFRALGNPLEEDTKIDLTALIPEYAWKKLSYSALGGALSCLLDLLPAIAAAALISGGNASDIKLLLICVPLILSVDLYAGSCGSFIALSTPANAGTTVKQLVQIMFIYFGLLPDVGVIAVAAVFGRTALGIFAASLLNLMLTMIFISLSGRLLDPRPGRPVYTDENCPGDPAEAKGSFDRIGRALFIMLAISTFLQLRAASQLPAGFGAEHPWLVWLVQMAPLYLVAIPVGLLIMKKLPASDGEMTRKLSLPAWLGLIPIGFFLMYSGNIIGLILSALFSYFFGGGAVSAADMNPLTDLFTDTQFLPRTLVVVVLAPVIEELLFRKALIRRTRRYGEKTAVVFSAVCFGLFHGNLPQFCYASLLGLLLGAVYIKTDRIVYTIGLHMCVNFMGGVIAPYIMTLTLESGEEGIYPAPVLAFFSLIVTLFFLGAAFLAQYSQRLSFGFAPSQLRPRAARRCAWLNTGMIMFVALSAAVIVLALL
ncbi:MAG: CPBP family intramembrane metalloprotease [Firmicutes bacterium]|nr:CPBP family intramembrane metalloprotease [Bacillota bacterium]